MKKLKNLFFVPPGLFLLISGGSFAVTCPDPEEVSESLDKFSLAEKETASFVDNRPGQVDRFDRQQPEEEMGIKFRVRPNCYSSNNFTMRGCPPKAFTTVTFSHAVLNRFRSGDNGTVWCYYKTPDGSMISVDIDAPSEGTYRVANPSGSAWSSEGRLLYRCQPATQQVESCSLDFESGKLPNALGR